MKSTSRLENNNYRTWVLPHLLFPPSLWTEIGELAISLIQAICCIEISGGERKFGTLFLLGLNRDWGTNNGGGGVRRKPELHGIYNVVSVTTLFFQLNFHLLNSFQFLRTNYSCRWGQYSSRRPPLLSPVMQASFCNSCLLICLAILDSWKGRPKLHTLKLTGGTCLRHQLYEPCFPHCCT